MLMARPLVSPPPILKKYVNGRDVSSLGAFARSDTLTLSVRVPRALGAAGVVLRLEEDGKTARDYPLAFVSSEAGVDTYEYALSLSSVTGMDGGLFYYELLFIRGKDTLFTNTAEDNVSFCLTGRSAGKFRLLVARDDFSTPQWFHGRTMYHIFVDRFAPGGGERREGAVYHKTWNEEILQFSAYPGAPVANNEFFGGTLWGVLDKLDYLESLGVGVIYLSPIFKADSNHKYDTGDYEEVDAQFGGEEALKALLKACRERDIGVILDGVFNHTGDDSRYFNRRGNYPTVGAYQSLGSPFADWYYFKKFPDSYESWWGIEILPKLNLSNPQLHKYLVGEGGIIEKYTRMGVRGWRLDVADELPNAFLEELRVRVKGETGGDGVIIGEVWENAADKIAYGKRRHYFKGKQLDSVMNYPLRRGLISFVKDGKAGELCAVLRELWGSYPKTVCHSLMNLLSSHDTGRILTVLAGEKSEGHTNAELRDIRMNEREKTMGRRRLKMAATLQYTVYGVPSLFSGDEAGLEGYSDPFCRRPFPWGREDAELLAHYRLLGKIRRENPVLADGDFSILAEEPSALVFERKGENGHLIVAANRALSSYHFRLPAPAVELLSGRADEGDVVVPSGSVAVWRVR